MSNVFQTGRWPVPRLNKANQMVLFLKKKKWTGWTEAKIAPVLTPISK